MADKRIGLLTGGADVPGLNSLIKSVVYGAPEKGNYEVIGIRRGWQGLTHLTLDGRMDREYIQPLNRENTRTIDRQGGTFLHTSRTNPSKMAAEKIPEYLRSTVGKLKEIKPGVLDMTPIVLENLKRLRIDYLIAIGGDETLSYAARLDKQGVPIIAVPKTRDNDVQNTEYCIGFSTALTRAVESINRQRSTIASHERVGIFRLFGRDAGFTTLYTAYLTSVRCCIPEVPFDLDGLIQLLIGDKLQNPSRYALVLLSEGSSWQGRVFEEYGEPDAYGHRKKVNIAEAFSDQMKKLTSEDTVVSDLTYELRSGEADSLDKLIATTFATMAIECVSSNAHGRMMAVRNGCYVDTDLPDPKLGPRRVDVSTMYNIDRYRPSYSSKRGMPILLTRV
jgi:6-phosphofructokinase